MLRKYLALLLTVVMVLSLAACSAPANEPTSTPAEEASAPESAAQGNSKFKIAVYTGTVSQGEEEFRAGEKMARKYPDIIVTQTYPDNFTKEQETVIANALALVSDPDVKALVMVQAVPGACAAFEKVREARPDVLIIAGVPGEDPDIIAKKADIVMQGDELAMGYSIPAQAQKLGAKTFVHYSFPRHMSYPLLAQRRDIFKAECERLGMKFVDATAPDPTGDAGVPGAQQFILEDVPRKVKEYGKDTNFFSTNCAMQEPLIKSVLEQGAIYAQQCCPSPYHGYPGALGIEIPTDKAGDVDYIVEQIRSKIAEKGGTGRFSTWPVPMNMMFIEAGVEYAKAWCEGTITSKNDGEALKRICSEVAGGAQMQFNTYTGKDKDGNDVSFDNFYMILSDFITF
ncbi:DUF3798 domain-containing protein [Lutispora thermophila]|uniref:DUF3798 domain-containing protein n=1 Tax=Lutispora thermophila DSM 19022 TaxID=1122184 RepID=A0A1M6GNI0_9FIRM|nr:DUF3798 domain-containing protein [Lutispora thermophila]SHJ11488.1 Protein of unknown function [Lutispora thermophila DSM 19022]